MVLRRDPPSRRLLWREDAPAEDGARKLLSRVLMLSAILEVPTDVPAIVEESMPRNSGVAVNEVLRVYAGGSVSTSFSKLPYPAPIE